MNPVTGPFNTVFKNDLRTAGSYALRQTGYKQAKPYNLPLAYYMRRTLVESLYRTGTYEAANIGIDADEGVFPSYAVGQTIGFNEDSRTANARALNLEKARMRFISSISKDQASLGISIVQSGQALDMISSRAGQLYQVFRACKKGDLTAARNLLGYNQVRPKASYRSRSREWANTYLELIFGWAPLVGDIQSAINVLQAPIPLARIRGTSTLRDPYTVPRVLAFEYQTSVHNCVHRALVQADVRVDNPNVYLANKLGLVNWASVAWDAIPWSFVVGWFVNVEQFLSQYTDLSGIKIENAFYREVLTDNMTYKSTVVATGDNWGYNYLSWSARRTLGIPSVTLRMKPYSLSPQRALTAISLLIQKGIRP